jgi:hypothetical protein
MERVLFGQGYDLHRIIERETCASRISDVFSLAAHLIFLTRAKIITCQ